MTNSQNAFNFTPEMLAASKPMTCECGGDKFRQAVMLRKVSKLITATPKDVLLPPIPVFECVECGTVLDELLPDFVKS